MTFLLAVPLNGLVGRDWIPPDDQGEITVLLNLPEGTSLEATSRLAADVAEKIARMKGVEFVNPYIHEGLMSHSHIYVKLVDLRARSLSNLDAAAEVRRICAPYPNLRTRVMIPSALGGGETFFPIRALILGSDFDRVAGIAKEASARIRTIRGLLDVDTSVSLNRPELQLRIDRQRASDLGVRAGDVGNAVRLMIAGEDQISTYKEGGEQYDVTLQLLPEQQKNPEVLSRLMIPSAKVGQVRLDNVAAIRRDVGPARIDRYNRQFQVSIYGNNAPDFPLDAAARAVGEEIRKTGLPEGYNFRFTGAVKILDETTRNLIIAFLLASIFMYMVLAAQFDSFLHPFTIMLSLPLSIPFALFSLWITGRTLNLWSSLGVLLLLGIVKKNGILQVGLTPTSSRADGPAPAGGDHCRPPRARLRPILMTTFSPSSLGSSPRRWDRRRRSTALGGCGDYRRALFAWCRLCWSRPWPIRSSPRRSSGACGQASLPCSNGSGQACARCASGGARAGTPASTREKSTIFLPRERSPPAAAGKRGQACGFQARGRGLVFADTRRPCRRRIPATPAIHSRSRHQPGPGASRPRGPPAFGRAKGPLREWAYQEEHS